MFYWKNRGFGYFSKLILKFFLILFQLISLIVRCLVEEERLNFLSIQIEFRWKNLFTNDENIKRKL